MDLSTMMSKIDLHKYQACKEFLDDIDLICANALEYNPATSIAGKTTITINHLDNPPSNKIFPKVLPPFK